MPSQGHYLNVIVNAAITLGLDRGLPTLPRLLLFIQASEENADVTNSEGYNIM